MPSATHLYLTDQASNQLLGYSIAANGVPTLLVNGTVPTDAGPRGLTIDITGKFLYVVNYTGNTIGGYTFGANGQPILSTVAASTQAGTGPTCVTTVGAPTNANPSHANLPVYIEFTEQFDYRRTNVAAGRQPEADLRVSLCCRRFADLLDSCANHSANKPVGLREYERAALGSRDEGST